MVAALLPEAAVASAALAVTDPIGPALAAGRPIGRAVVRGRRLAVSSPTWGSVAAVLAAPFGPR